MASGRKLIISGITTNRKIHAIKALREVTGFGLKDTKDIIDAVDFGQPYIFSYNGYGDVSIDCVLRILRDGGCTVNFNEDGLDELVAKFSTVDILKALAKNRIDENDFDTAKILCETIKTVRYQ